MPADLPSETAVEHALRLANEAKATGLIGDYAIAGAFAFIYYCEPFETKDFDLLVSLTTTPSGLIDLGPLRVSRLLVDFVPVADALDADALAHAVNITVGAQPARILTAEHAVAVAVRTARPQDRMKIARLLTSAPDSLDRTRLDTILEKHGLLLKWQKMQLSLSDQ